MITVELFEPQLNNIEACSERLRQELLPLYTKQWDTLQKHKFDHEFSLHVPLFLDMWLRGNSKIFVAYENNQPVGFCVCIVFRPMQFETSVLQVHDCFSNGRLDVHAQLIDKITASAKLLGCREVWFDMDSQEFGAPNLDAAWRKANIIQLARYVRTD